MPLHTLWLERRGECQLAGPKVRLLKVCSTACEVAVLMRWAREIDAAEAIGRQDPGATEERMSLPHNTSPPCACVECTFWRKGRDEERAAIVADLRTHGIGMSVDDAKKARDRGLAGYVVAFALQALGGISQGLADYFERGGHLETEGKATTARAKGGRA